MSEQQVRISVRGQGVAVPSICVEGRTIVVTGRLLKIAGVQDEEYVEGDPVGDPEKALAALKAAGTKADLFTFAQRIPDLQPRYRYLMRWDNVAAVPIRSYDDWWNSLSQETRRNVRLAAKRGLRVEAVPFDDKLTEGIVGIYNETPFRQGRPFWHYGKDLAAVKRENGTFPERHQFIAAYHGEELVGFIKIVFVDRLASIMQILSKAAHQDKRPTNALIAKAVEVTHQRGMSHLLYCKYVYHQDYKDALTEFKRRMGFQQVNIPRYFLPLTAKGRIAVALKLQAGLKDVLPKSLIVALLRLRARYYSLGYIQSNRRSRGMLTSERSADAV